MQLSQISSWRGEQGIAVQADVAIAKTWSGFFKESMDAFRGPDVVVHCAGNHCRSSDCQRRRGAFDKVIATNLRGTFLVSRRRLNMFSMAAASGFFSAVFSPSPSRTYGAYIASKAGVEGCSLLANELPAETIHGGVNAVAPGQVQRNLS